MFKYLLCAIALTLFSCARPVPTEGVVLAPRTYTPSQLRGVETMDPLRRSVMDECFLVKARDYALSFEHCVDRAMSVGAHHCPSQKSNAGSAAAGAAMGVIGTKILLRK